MLFYRAALPLSRVTLPGRGDPPLPQADRLVLAQVQPAAAGAVLLAHPAQGPDVRRTGRRVRHRDRRCLAVCAGDGGSAPDGEIVWVSGPLPGVVHDLTAARIWGIIRELAAAG
jgi:hypothetical protein